VIGYGGTTLLDPLSVPLRRDVRLLFDASSAAARERFFDLGPRSRDGVSESVPYSSFSVAPRVFSFELPSFRNFDARRGIANVLAREKRCDFESLLFLFLFLFLFSIVTASPRHAAAVATRFKHAQFQLPFSVMYTPTLPLPPTARTHRRCSPPSRAQAGRAYAMG
jgi:hypothetical protein